MASRDLETWLQPRIFKRLALYFSSITVHCISRREIYKRVGTRYGWSIRQPLASSRKKNRLMKKQDKSILWWSAKSVITLACMRSSENWLVRFWYGYQNLLKGYILGNDQEIVRCGRRRWLISCSSHLFAKLLNILADVWRRYLSVWHVELGWSEEEKAA